jgi:hypothetical protein
MVHSVPPMKLKAKIYSSPCSSKKVSVSLVNGVPHRKYRLHIRNYIIKMVLNNIPTVIINV